MIFTEIWMGSRNLQAAIDNDDLEVIGDTVYLRNLTKWLGLNIYAKHNPKFQPDKTEE